MWSSFTQLKEESTKIDMLLQCVLVILAEARFGEKQNNATMRMLFSVGHSFCH
jgi:hypothetical protein